MMKSTRFFAYYLAVMAILYSCVSQKQPVDTYPSLDDVIKEAAFKTVEILPDDAQRSIAVYYFTTGGEESELSDYIINGLTTELANAAQDMANVLSRQALDRILNEYSHQLSDLVDSKAQVTIGKQLGADLILTGFITPGTDALQLNAQVIEVESARVLGGYVLSFQKPANIDFIVDSEAASVASVDAPAGDAGPSETTSAKREYPISQGVSTATTIYEDFESGISEMTLRHNEDHWGERIQSAKGKTKIVKGEDSSFAAYTFEATFDSADLPHGWEDSYVDFYFTIGTGQAASSYDGISFKIKLENMTAVYPTLMQYADNNTYHFGVPLMLVPGKWYDLKLPFEIFLPYDPGMHIDTSLPLDLEFYASFEENRSFFHLKDGTEIAGEIAVDDIGFYKLKSADPSHVIESFEDEITRAAITAEMYGSFVFTDYSTSDDGILVKNEGVEDQLITVERIKDGPVGTYLDIRADLTVNEKFPGIYALYPYIRILTSADFADYSFLTFLIRASHESDVGLEIVDFENDAYYYWDFAVSENWTRIRIPFSSLEINDPASLSGLMRLDISCELLPDQMADTIDNGHFFYNLSIDELVLEGD